MYKRLGINHDMSLSGFKKQFNKTSQLLSEKVSGNKGSQHENEFMDLGRKLDVITECVENIQIKTKIYLQPNPTFRTKMAVQASCLKACSPIKRHANYNAKYPQPELSLAEVFYLGGGKLNDDSPYSAALTELGTAFNWLSEIKDKMENNVRKRYLEPLELQQRDLREINHHKKKLENRRLDYDYKRRKGGTTSEEELLTAEDKFVESKQLCYNSMMDFMDDDVKHIGQMLAFAESVRDYHKQCTDIMELVTESLASRRSEAQSRPHQERLKVAVSNDADDSNDSVSNNRNSTGSDAVLEGQWKLPSTDLSVRYDHPCARALYDFDARNEGELGFWQGEMIELKDRIDEHWLEGSCNGRHGYFPENYVHILVPLNFVDIKL